MPTRRTESERFSTAKVNVTYFQAASGVAAGVGVGRPTARPISVGSAGGMPDSSTRTMTAVRAASGRGVGVAAARGAMAVGTCGAGVEHAANNTKTTPRDPRGKNMDRANAQDSRLE